MASDSIVVRTTASKCLYTGGGAVHIIGLEPDQYTSDTLVNIEWAILAKIITASDDHTTMRTEVFPFRSLLLNKTSHQAAYNSIVRRLRALMPEDISLTIRVERGDAYNDFVSWLQGTHDGSIVV